VKANSYEESVLFHNVCAFLHIVLIEARESKIMKLFLQCI
jgi:hypothetical protein